MIQMLALVKTNWQIHRLRNYCGQKQMVLDAMLAQGFVVEEILQQKDWFRDCFSEAEEE